MMLKTSARRSPTGTGCCVCGASAASMPYPHCRCIPRVGTCTLGELRAVGSGAEFRPRAAQRTFQTSDAEQCDCRKPSRRHRPCHALVVHRLTRPSQLVRLRGHALARCCRGAASITRGSARFSALLPRDSLHNIERASHHAWHCRATFIALSVHSTRPRFSAMGTSGFYFINGMSIISSPIYAWRCPPAAAPSRLHFCAGLAAALPVP